MSRAEIATAAFEGSRVGSAVVCRFGGQFQSIELCFNTASEAEMFAAALTALCRADAGKDEVDVSCLFRVQLRSRKTAK